MIFLAIFISISLSMARSVGSQVQQESFPVPKGPFLGRKPPGITLSIL
jgi:hypothetical protein